FVLLDFGKAVARVHLTWAARHREIRFRFVGEAGEIAGNEDQISLDADGQKEEIRFEQGLSHNSSHSEWYAPLFRDFLGRLGRRVEEEDGDGLEEGLDTVRFVTRAYESSSSGRRLGFHADAEARPQFAEPLAVAGEAVS